MLARLVLFLIGFSAVIAQVVLVRELIVVFHGNEASLGLMLASWLAWTAAGSSIAGYIPAKNRAHWKRFTLLMALSAVVFPLTIAAVRYSRGFLQTVPGELLGPVSTLLASALVLAPFCLISGALFTAGCRLRAAESSATPGEAGATVYLLEGIGSAVGGLVASLLLIRRFPPFGIAALLAWCNLTAAAVFAGSRTKRRLLSVLFSAALVPLLAASYPFLERVTLARLWKGMDVLEAQNSRYGNLVLVKTEDGTTLYENGLPLATSPDRAAAEESVHYALLEHPDPHRVLLIGGGANGSISEVLRHPSVEQLDYVDLDPAILDLVDRHSSPAWHSAVSSPRVHIYATDGRLFLKTTSDWFDVVIVNLPDPQTAQLNRFYTEQFFREAAARLRPGGVLALNLTGAENYISPDLAAFLRSIRKTLAVVFPEVVVLPGGTVHFFAAVKLGTLVSDSQALIARLRERNLQTKFVREYFLPFRMMPDRMTDVDVQTLPLAATPVNRDFSPIAYYFDIALWSRQFHPKAGAFFATVSKVKFQQVVFVTLVCLLAAAVILRRRPDATHARATAGFCIFAMGFTLMALQVLLLLAFQSVYGYVYDQLAILVAAFMGGAALGSWLALRRTGTGMRSLGVLQSAALLSAPALVGISMLLSRMTSAAGMFLSGQIVFPGLALAAGLMGGYQFPVASRLFFAEDSTTSRHIGALYALDLVGACAAALAIATWLIPVFGFTRTAVLVAAVNVAPFLLSVTSLRLSRPASLLQTRPR